VEAVKKVVSVSIGSSVRDHEVELELDGQRIRIRREGTDGDIEAAVKRIAELDGTVDAIGLGGVDLHIRANGRTYTMRDPKKMADAATTTPTLDGSGLKNTLERQAVTFLQETTGIPLAGKRVLITSAVDRFGMAEAFHEAGCRMTFGDLVFGLGLPFPIRSWRVFNIVARILLPVVCQLPFKWLYPTGASQEAESDPRFTKLYEQADIIAGDFLYVRKYMPRDMTGKWVLTNTTTASDVEELARRGVELLVTTTPRLEGRSFGTNVIEATIVALQGANGPLEPERYIERLKEVGIAPQAHRLQDPGAVVPIPRGVVPEAGPATA